jgi:F-type H+-transporting ATPase subunit epsilon
VAFKLTILTPEGKAFEGDVASVTVPGVAGQFGVQTGHAPMVSALKAGVVKVSVDSPECSYWAIAGGVMEIRPAEAALLADLALPAPNRFDAEHKLEMLLTGNKALEPATW